MKWFVTLLCAVALMGCNSQDADNLSKDAKNLASDVGQSIGGMTLAGKVNTALALRKDVDMKGLHIEAKDGVVTVTGHVKSAEEKGRVFDVINNTVGVEKVDNTGLRVEQ
ncbi:MAG TPA: BON domain-containing protein [Fimbriimonadaceae bacterium]|nr:BON domain-containing protein [Fimbriimonadaceae bacterium]